MICHDDDNWVEKHLEDMYLWIADKPTFRFSPMRPLKQKGWARTPMCWEVEE